jgi:hypothetical protein
MKTRPMITKAVNFKQKQNQRTSDELSNDADAKTFGRGRVLGLSGRFPVLKDLLRLLQPTARIPSPLHR